MFEVVHEIRPQARIKVVGVGGGGGNALNTMIRGGIKGVDFLAANTDAQHLTANLAPTKIQLGPTLTKGLGAGNNPEIGKNAALESQEEIAAALEGADMVFVACGMGGGTGTGAAPVIANIARSLGALTVAIVTRPFRFEGGWRQRLAEQGIGELSGATDAMITIPNQNLVALAANQTRLTFADACKLADGVLLQAVDGVVSLVNLPGIINIDFADVKTIMSNTGTALMGMGIGEGEGRMMRAVQAAVTSPLLDNVSVDGATGLIVNITGGSDMAMVEIDEAVSSIEQAASEAATVLLGPAVDDPLGPSVRVLVIATGFDVANDRIPPPQRIAPAATTASRRGMTDHYAQVPGNAPPRRTPTRTIGVPARPISAGRPPVRLRRNQPHRTQRIARRPPRHPNLPPQKTPARMT